MNRLSHAVVFVALAVASALPACTVEQPEFVERESSALTSADRALHWAPIHYQDVNTETQSPPFSGWGGKADLITSFNYDNDWVGNNNWDALPFFATPAVAYYLVSETSTHWFIAYMFYHPRDWDDGVDFGDIGEDAQEHENDLEGVVTAVRKDDSTWGKLEAAATVYHNGWRIYRHPDNAPYLGTGSANPPAIQDMAFEQSGLFGDDVWRLVTNAQPEGHGVTVCTPQNGANCGFTHNDSIRYLPSAVYADNPNLPPDETIVSAKYKLVDMMGADGLWPHRFDHQMAASWNAWAGDESGGCGAGLPTCSENSVGPPWTQADSLDNLLIADSPKVFADYFTGWDNAVPERALSLDSTSPIGTTRAFDTYWRPAAADATTDRSVAVATRDSRLYLFAKAIGDGARQVKFSAFDGANWTPYIDVPGGASTTDAAPAAGSCNQKLFVVVKPGTGAQQLSMISKTSTGNPLTGWGSWATVPEAVVRESGTLACRGTTLYLFVRGMDDQIYFTTFDASNQWGSWQQVPGGAITYKAPSAVVDAFTNNSLNLVVVGTDGHPYLNRLCATCGDQGWAGWSVHPGWTNTNQPVALVSDYPGTLMVYQTPAYRVDADLWNGSEWRGPSTVRGRERAMAAPAAIGYGGNLYLFANDVQQAVWMTVASASVTATRGLLLSQRKDTDQISTYNSSWPSRAIDGGTIPPIPFFDVVSRHIDGWYSDGYTTHTNAGNQPWWQVDLGSVRTIREIDVWNRTDCCANRLREWSILISDDGAQWTKIFSDSRAEGAGKFTALNGSTEMYNGALPAGTGGTNAGRTFNVSTWSSRYVRVQINRPNEYLHLAEVQVWGF